MTFNCGIFFCVYWQLYLELLNSNFLVDFELYIILYGHNNVLATPTRAINLKVDCSIREFNSILSYKDLMAKIMY